MDLEETFLGFDGLFQFPKGASIFSVGGSFLVSASGNLLFSFAKPQKQLIIDSKTDASRQQNSLCASIKQNCVPDIFSEIQFLSRFGTLWSHLGWSQLIFSESFLGVWECLTLRFRTHTRCRMQAV